MSKNKFYVVWEGREKGIFSSWDKCKKAVENYPKAKYKGFVTKELAQQAFLMGYQVYKKSTLAKSTVSQVAMANVGKPKLPSISVDAACSGNPGVMEYRGVHTATKEEIFRLPPMEDGTNNIGEFLAIVHALALMKKNNQTMPIYTDSHIAIKWIHQKKCKTKLKETPKNEKIFELIDRAECWLEQNTYLNPILKWETKFWGEIPADFGRKG